MVIEPAFCSTDFDGPNCVSEERLTVFVHNTTTISVEGFSLSINNIDFDGSALLSIAREEAGLSNTCDPSS